MAASGPGKLRIAQMIEPNRVDLLEIMTVQDETIRDFFDCRTFVELLVLIS